MSFQPQEKEPDELDELGLTIGTRINYQYLLGQQINLFQRSIVKEEGQQSPQEVLESAIGLYEMIPDTWRESDPKFQDEYQAAVKLRRVDNRKTWCGVRVGQSVPTIIKRLDPYKLFHACINLLSRRGLLARTLYQEIATGNLFDDLEETDVSDEESPDNE